ncbi:MAG TPA: thiamine diphosphokinase [bacterium]|nr:thiamine diphosphokinase [bacterium]
MRAAILAGGRLRVEAGLRVRLRDADLLICADGGLRAARRLRIRPHAAVGDFDSASPALVAWARSAGASIVRHPVEKDQTDAELALDYAVSHGARDVECFGTLGGRLDHLLANVALLLRARARGARVRIVDGAVEAFLAGPRTPLDARPGDLVSLLSLSARSSGVTTRGLKYPLRNAVLREGSTLGISNEAVTSGASVSLRAGDLLIVRTRRRRGGLRANV